MEPAYPPQAARILAPYFGVKPKPPACWWAFDLAVVGDAGGAIRPTTSPRAMRAGELHAAGFAHPCTCVRANLRRPPRSRRTDGDSRILQTKGRPKSALAALRLRLLKVYVADTVYARRAGRQHRPPSPVPGEKSTLCAVNGGSVLKMF